jgi:ABC-type amino acid transport system permease subunit
MSPLAVSGIVFAIVFVGALFGLLVRTRLPEHHLSAESKDVVKLAMGILGTMTALVLGLLIASAKGSYDTQRNGVSQLAANVLVLNRTLALYGKQTEGTPEGKKAQEIRDLLRASLADLVHRTWPEERAPAEQPGTKGGTEGRYEEVYERILALEPKTDAQRTLQSQALKMVTDIGQLRWNLAAQRQASSIPIPFLVVMVFWLALILLSFGLFAPGNPTAVLSLAVCTLAVSSAIFLILELDRPFGGIIQISGEPLRAALEQIGR